MPLPQALAIGLAFSLFIGAVNGWLVAYVEIPAIFATLAMGTLVYGFGRYFLFDLDVAYMPEAARQLLWLGQGTLFGIPVPIFLFAGVCLGGYLFLRYAQVGPLSARRRRQSARRAHHRRSGASDHRPAIRAVVADRLSWPASSRRPRWRA